MSLKVLEHAERSDTGLVRPANEDSFLARPPVFVVADGMGGASAGEVASRLAVETFAAGLPPGGDPVERLSAAVSKANAAINAQAGDDPARQGMGTTVTAVMVDGGQLSVAHVGDSRAYSFRAGSLERLTRDHTLVDELVQQGRLTPEEAAVHPQRSIITRALGPEREVEVDSSVHALEAGDVILLCSDGLTGMIDEERIASILSQSRSLAAASRALVKAANDAGGRDNITVVLFRVGSGGAPLAATRPLARRSRAGGAAAPGGRRPGRRGLIALAAVIVAVLVLAGAWRASRGVFFLGTDSAGVVTVYQGVPYDLIGGLPLYSAWYRSGVPAESLTAAQRRVLLDHRLRSKQDASGLAASLERGELQR